MTVVGQVKIDAARVLAESPTIDQTEILARIWAILDLGNNHKGFNKQKNGIAILGLRCRFFAILIASVFAYRDLGGINVITHFISV